MVFLDISRAFDRVWHEGLLHKLKIFGIEGNLFNWFCSYLSGRSQRVVLSGCASVLMNLFAGVPQGSKLSPLLFLIFLNDIETDLTSEISLFADDTALVQSFKNHILAESILNNDLEKIERWATKWCVEFNHEKTEMIIFSNKKNKSHLNLKLKKHNITKSFNHKHLGIILSADLKWSSHIDYCTKKARMKLGMLYRRSSNLNLKQKISIYMSTIRPILEYGSIIFDNCSMSDKLKLEKCQRPAAIICTGAMRRTETETLLKELRWDSLAARRHLLKISFFHKIVEGTISPYLQKNLTFINQGTVNHNTRMARLQKIKPLQCRLESYKKSFFPQCINEWNGLPENITSITNDNSFKNKLKHHYQMHTGLNKIGLQNYSYPGFL